MLFSLLRPLMGLLGAAALWGLLPSHAAAHPHVWISVETTVVYENGSFTGFRHRWTFDEFYTAMAVEGLDKNNDGKYDRDELAELAKVNVEGLKDFSYFTYPLLGGRELKVGEVSDYWLEHKDGILTLNFVLPLAQPVLSDAKGFTFSVYDPSYFIAFDLVKDDPVKLSAGAPKNCRLNVGVPAKDNGQTSALNEAFSAQLGAFSGAAIKSVTVECSAP
ncbi:MAG: DUF1007 family protein [Hyphomicrobiaceae bacterium]|nr:MAG: DUF1007 family protein [Hyphomicrobiaceae bacterium]